MAEYRKLLLIASPGMQRTPALVRATELARKTGASLHLLLVAYNHGIANLRRIDESVMRLAADNYMKIRLDWLEGEVARLRGEGLKAECSAIWGKSADEIIVGTVLDMKPDLVIKDVQATQPILRTLFTPLDWELLRLCPAPLMLVNSQSNPYPKRIIATVDPMEDGDHPHELNDQVLRSAQTIATKCGAELHAVYAYPHAEIPAEPVTGAAVTPYTKIRQQARATHQKAFARLLDGYSVPPEQRHFLEGDEIEDAIGDFADRTDSDLIVLGTVYRSAVDRLMLGSSAERMLDRVDCDVLVIKPAGFAEQAQHLFKPQAGPGITYQPA